jgi:hypothetical protein
VAAALGRIRDAGDDELRLVEIFGFTLRIVILREERGRRPCTQTTPSELPH